MKGTCKTPTSFEKLASWWLDELTEDDAKALEDHCFSCDACGRACAALAPLVDGLRAQVPPVISRAHVERLQDAGARLLLTQVEPGTSARARFAREIDLLVHVLRGDLSAADRIDVELVGPDGATVLTFEHVPFDREAGEVLIACQRHYQHMFVSDLVFRVRAFTGEDQRRVGDYVVLHEWL